MVDKESIKTIPNYLIGLILIILLLFPVKSSFPQVIQKLTADRFTHYQIDDWVSYAPALFITSIDIDENYIYFGTRSGGILRYHKYQNYWDYPFTTSNGLRSNIIFSVVYSISDGSLYAQTPTGIDVYRYAGHFWQPSDRKTMPERRQPPIKDVSGIQRKKDFRFPQFYRPPTDFLPNFFTDISLTYHLDGTVYDQYNREFKLTDRITDMWQRLWAGTDGFGPMKADLSNFWIESIPQSISNISPRDLFIQGDKIWIGGQHNSGTIRGITSWDRSNDQWKYYEAQFIHQINNDDVFAIDGNENHILFATDYGLTIYNIDKDKWKALTVFHGLNADKVLDVLIVKDQAFVGTEYGFNWIDLKSMKVSKPADTKLDNVRINQLAYANDKIWAATRYGLYSYQIKDDIINFHPSKAALVDFNLTAIEAVGDEIWIANEDGIAYWNTKENKWLSFPGLNFHAQINDISATKNFMWFATDEGLLKFDRVKNYWRLFTEKDGLISKNIYHIDPEGDDLWISAEAGITLFRWYSENRID